MTILALEEAFTPFLKPDVMWGRKTKTSPLRGFHGSDAAQQVTTLETMLGLIANYAPIVSRGTIVKNCTSLNAVWKALHLYYGIQSSDDAHHLPNSKILHQSHERSYQECSMFKPARKSSHDVQQLSKDDKALHLKSEPKLQTYAVDTHICFSDDENNSKDIIMNTDTVQIQSENEVFLPDSADVISLSCYVPNVLPTEPKQFLSSDQKSNVLSRQNVPSSEYSFLGPLFMTLSHSNVQSSLLPSTRQESGSEKASSTKDDKLDLQNLQSSLPIKEVPHDQTEEYTKALIDHPTKNQGNVTNTSFSELRAKPSHGLDDNAPVNRTDNCLLSDSPILPDSSTFDLCPHPVKSHAQPDYLPEQLIRDRHQVQYPQQFVTSAAIPLSTSETQCEIFHARSIDKAYSCDSTRGRDELLKLVNESESVKPSQEEIPKHDLHGMATPIPGHSEKSQKPEPVTSKGIKVDKHVGEQPAVQEPSPHNDDIRAMSSLASLVPLTSGNAVSSPLLEYTDDEKSSFPLDIPSATAYNWKPLNLIQETPGKAPSHSRPREEPVTATDTLSTEQIVEPCTQKAGNLLVRRADNSHLSNSFFSLGSSSPKPYHHPDQIIFTARASSWSFSWRMPSYPIAPMTCFLACSTLIM